MAARGSAAMSDLILASKALTCFPKLYQSLLESEVGMVPLGAGWRNPPGSIGGRQPAYPAMRPHMVVVVAPYPQDRAGMAE